MTLHGTMQCNHPLQDFSYQSSCEFSCEEGYTLTGSSSSWLMCDTSGHWNDSQPTCEGKDRPQILINCWFSGTAVWARVLLWTFIEHQHDLTTSVCTSQLSAVRLSRRQGMGKWAAVVIVTGAGAPSAVMLDSYFWGHQSSRAPKLLSGARRHRPVKVRSRT